MPSPAATGPDTRAPVETGLLTIDLAALAANWRALATRSAPAECSAVIKANAYGIGLEEAMRALLGAGCRTFFVANLAEGERARAVSAEAVVYVLDGLPPGVGERLAAANLRPVLGSLEDVDAWTAQGYAARAPLSAALHIDTGMNRYGLPPALAGEAARRAAGVRLTLVMSHFVSSQLPQDPRNAGQIAAFATACAAFPGVPASLCNSSGIFLPQHPHLALTRPGYALYGGNPTPHAPNPMRPVVRLEARIVATREIAAGESVGYDATWTAPRPARLATLGVGYADGIPVSASAHAEKLAAEALVGGQRCPFVGRVSMDFVVLDVTNARAARCGDWVEIVGDTIGVDDFAARSHTIGYEILTRLGTRYARRYVG